MNRVIKFRGLSEADNVWVHGAYFEHKLLYGSHSEIIVNVDVPNDWDDIEQIKIHVKRHTIGQFTGLTDKNGKEIYEGDILFGREEGDGETTAWTDVYYIVFFKDGCFKVRERRIDEDSCWCDILCENNITEEYEVIGNIHQNPELLKP